MKYIIYIINYNLRLFIYNSFEKKMIDINL